jgi:hypothetical protein
MAAWVDKLGVSRDLIKSRLREGWAIEQALTTPPRTYVKGWKERVRENKRLKRLAKQLKKKGTT